MLVQILKNQSECKEELEVIKEELKTMRDLFGRIAGRESKPTARAKPTLRAKPTDRAKPEPLEKPAPLEKPTLMEKRTPKTRRSHYRRPMRRKTPDFDFVQMLDFDVVHSCLLHRERGVLAMSSKGVRDCLSALQKRERFMVFPRYIRHLRLPCQPSLLALYFACSVF